MSNHEILEFAALVYAKQGFRIIPVRRNKAPLIPNWPEKATSDIETVKSWWIQYPEANIGVATGRQPAGFGFMVVDIDTKNGKRGDISLAKLITEYGELPETISAQTPSGGRHIFLKYPQDLELNGGIEILGPGIDVLAEGRQVLVYPSFTAVGKYSLDEEFSTSRIGEAPQWLLEYLLNETKNGIVHPGDGIRTNGIAKAETIRELLKVIPSRPRYTDWIRIISAVLSMAGGDKDLAEQLLKEWSPEEKPGEYRYKLDHSLDQVTAGTLFYYARKHGYQQGVTRDFILRCLNLDERGDAILFASMVKNRSLYDHDNKTFLVYEEGVWKEDRRQKTQRELPEKLRAAYLPISSQLDDEIVQLNSSGDKDEIKGLEIIRDRLRKRAHLLNQITRVRHVSEFLRREIASTTEDFDKCDHLLNLINGTYNLQEDTFQPHNAEDRISLRAEVEYDQEAEAPHWQDFLEVVFSGDSEVISFIQSYVGYLLSGSTDQDLMLFLYGTGANGKSTFVSVLEMLLGDYFRSIPIDALLVKQSNSTDQYHIAEMRGKRCCVASEVPQGRRLNESLLKDLTGGDTMTGRVPYGRPFNFRPRYKLILMGNHKPVIKGMDVGIWRRVCLLLFPVQIEKAKQIPRTQLIATMKRELPGILNWAIKGYRQYAERGLVIPASIREATDKYKSDSDTIGAFLKERYELSDSEKIIGTVLYGEYSAWCEDSGERPLSRKYLYSALRDRGFVVETGTGNRTEIHGIAKKS